MTRSDPVQDSKACVVPRRPPAAIGLLLGAAVGLALSSSRPVAARDRRAGRDAPERGAAHHRPRDRAPEAAGKRRPPGPGPRASNLTPVEAEQRVRAALSCFSHEPSVRWVLRRAYAQALAEPWRARSWLVRARRAAWLPELQVGVGGHRLRDESVDREVGAPMRLDRGGRNQITYELKLSWDLPRLIFNPDTLKVVREAGRLAELRDQVSAQVIRLYFARRRLQLLALLGPRVRASTQVRRRLRIAELTALIDAVTGGAFGAALARRRAGRWAAPRVAGRADAVHVRMRGGRCPR